MRRLAIVAIALGLLAGSEMITPDAVEAQECEWCQIEFCGGTSVCGHECNNQGGDFPVTDCQATVQSCGGDNCYFEEEQLPDMTVLAVVRACDRTSATHGVVADLWRGLVDVDEVTQDGALHEVVASLALGG